MNENLIIAVSGTPGTGKSTFSKHLAKELHCELVDLNKIIEDEDIYELDAAGTKLVDPEDLIKAFNSYLDGEDKKIVVDGLLSHLLSPKQVTHVVVLRTHPDILEERLAKRDYPTEKLEENIESEALGVVLEEAIEKHGVEKVYEIDTTSLEPEEAVNDFKKALEERALQPGSVDWMKDYYKNS